MDGVVTKLLMEFNQGIGHTYRFPSCPADAMNSQEGERPIAKKGWSCCRCCPMRWPEVESQKRTVLSKETLARTDPSGERESEYIQWVWPVHGCSICSPMLELQPQIASSHKAVKSLLPSHDHSTELTKLSWPFKGPRMSVPFLTS